VIDKMKIISKERLNKIAYDEAFYVSYSYKKILKNPNKKIYRITKVSLMYCIFSVISFLLFSIHFFINGYYGLTLFHVFTIILFVIFYILYQRSKKQLNEIMNDKRELVFYMDKDILKVDTTFNGIKIAREFKWDNIKYIISTDNSIFFITNNEDVPFILLDIKYKEKTFREISDLKKGHLIVEHSKYSYLS